jgi:oligoendopeptidase F
MNIKTNWDLSKFDLKSFPKYREELSGAANIFINKWKNDNSFLSDSKKLLEALEEYNSWIESYKWGGFEGQHLFLAQSLKEDDPEIKADYNQFIDFINKLSTEFSFFSISLSKIPEKQQKIFLADKSLEKFWYYLEVLFKGGKHTLSKEEERIITFMSKTSYENWVSMVSEFVALEEATVLDSDEKEVTLPFAEIMSLIDSKNKKVRDRAGKVFLEVNSKWAPVSTHEINSVLESKKNDDFLRGFKNPEDETLLGDQSDKGTVDALIKSVSEGFQISKDFYEIKAKLLGQKKLEFYERNVPLSMPDKKYTLEEAIEITGRVFKNIDQEFYDIYQDMIERSLVDFMPMKGKSQGAFCMPSFKKGDIHILMNFTGRLQDVLTLAHEFGHAINHKLSRKQIGVYDDVSIATTEVASTFFEDYVLEELKKESDDETKLGLLIFKLNEDVSSIFRQVACYKFEQDLHKKFRERGYVAKDEIGEMYLNNMKAYMGDYVNYTEGAKNTWVYWSHSFMFIHMQVVS